MTHLRLIPAAATHRGMRRRHNEDAIAYDYPADVAVLDSHGALFVVADGVGGLSAGDEASQLTVRELIKIYYATDTDKSIEDRLIEAVQAVNTIVFETLNRTGATTLVAAVLHRDHVIVASAGDSPAFRINGDDIARINKDDVLNSDTEENGALTKAIGYRETIEIDPIRLQVKPGQQLLLCSDGLTRYLNETQLINLARLRDPRDSVRRMINQANAAGGADNISAIVVNIDDEIPADEIAAHIANISVRVAVDTDPMMMQDVPSKPTTQIPMARPVSSIDESLLNETVPAPHQPAQSSSPVQAKSPDNGLVILIIVGVALLLVGGVIFGIAFATLNNGEPDNETLPDDATMIEITTTDSQIIITDAESDSDTVSNLQEGDIIFLDSNVMTKNNIDSNVDAFLALAGTPYSINTITLNEGLTWYRLVEDNTDRTGWLDGETLPSYQLQDD